MGDSVVSDGAKRSISACQLASSEAGATSRCGGAPLRARRLRSSRSASTWMVLPSPMSSARQTPRRSDDANASHATPVF